MYYIVFKVSGCYSTYMYVPELPTILQGYLSHRDLECPLSKEAVTEVSLASAELFTLVRKVLSRSSLPGRHHYVFSLSHIAVLFQVSL